jgi:hypothetical protein
MSDPGRQAHRNPFDGWKASLLSSEEITRTWVELPEPGFDALAEPTSSTPTYVIGGKGSGKTHLMRRLSYDVQKLRTDGSRLAEVQRLGYVGVSVLFGGFNASRFTQKGLNESQWRQLYTYNLDLWLARATLMTYHDLLAGEDAYGGTEAELCAKIRGLFDEWHGATPQRVETLIESLDSLQAEFDASINNLGLAATWTSPPPRIRATPPTLVFGLPQALAEVVPALSDVRTLYLLDELENLPTDHQRYVNTLIREQTGPISIKIGSRLYGRRTFDTYTGETNRVGSEYDVFDLDRFLARDRGDYARFCREIVARRLLNWQGRPSGPDAVAERARRLDNDFEDPATDAERRIAEALERRGERPWFRRLLGQLRDHASAVRDLGVIEDRRAEIVDRLRAPHDPMLEKANLVVFYRGWSNRHDLDQTSRLIAEQASIYDAEPKGTEQQKVLRYFRADLAAQLLQDLGLPQPYPGLKTLIELSDGLPRYLLVILKHAYRTALFNGEQPFENGPISLAIQRAAIAKGVERFREDNRPPGELGQAAVDGVDRLANLFRAMRFSDKPAESSLCAFAADVQSATFTARRVVEVAEEWSLLRTIAERADRNTSDRDQSFRLNRMLAPVYDLPLGRRGVIDLTGDELNAIFDPEHVDKYDDVRERRLGRLHVPFRRPSTEQLPGL